ncbi:phospholipase A(1) LCAT3 isoform X1 [Elaeis guineensis]|uniref:Phospholipase A(1) LCAT3 isoform X1 n=1 Tax=Elaeis guineensis var. tenera TaxID=51953 RepID=A0A6I9QMF4_ELAGV|nr:phospholipase A(1) LCAT3 isoform X1 [Elaeis guineensis]
MFGECGLRLPCLGRGRRRAAAGKELEPVLLVSGIGGSVLNARNKKTGRKICVWVRILLANLEFKKYVWSMYNTETGYVESLDPDYEIVVPEDDYGLHAIDILDPSWWAKCLHLTDVYHFHDMIDMLVECGYEKGTTLFGFGYDFRQSNRIDKTLDDLRVKLESAYKASGGKKVNIISHSMGGLLLRCFISLYNDVFAKYVNKWICIACPFQGAPGCINDSLLTGLQFVYGFESFFFVSRWTMHQLLIECPSIYEMLPNPEFNWNQQPVIQVWRKPSEDNEAVKLDVYDPTECISLFEEALRDNELTYNGKSIALPFNFSILKWAADTRQILDNAQLPSSVGFYNIYGTSFDSPHDVCYGSETSPITNLSEVCHTTVSDTSSPYNLCFLTLFQSLILEISEFLMVGSQPEYTYVDGDGTVPAESAKADGFAAVARVAVESTHRELLKDKRVFQLLKQWLGVNDNSQHSMSSSKVMDVSIEPIPIELATRDLL